MANREVLLDVRHLKKDYPVAGGIVHAVDDVSFQLYKGETLGLVGESGCGKTTLGQMVIRLLEATDGEILYQGEDLRKVKDMKPYRRKMQMVFQDPYGSLNPRLRIQTAVGEALSVHGLVHNKKEKGEKVGELLSLVGLQPEDQMKYPHEFSGGQRQRIGIARALAVGPELLVCDEPVSALDVSIQSQILNLLADIRKEMNLSMIFIAHGLNVVKHISDRVGVMYLGKLVEIGPKEQIFNSPRHPYTKALLASVPQSNLHTNYLDKGLEGELPSPMNPPKGCCFSTRCPYADERCKMERPELASCGDEHFTACFKSYY